jgi:hypothetical protein
VEHEEVWICWTSDIISRSSGSVLIFHPVNCSIIVLRTSPQLSETTCEERAGSF